MRGAAPLLLLAILAGARPASAACTVTGPRYVAPGGTNAPSQCTDSAHPCGSIQYAIGVACDNETVNVALGEYLEDVVITHPVVVQGTGDLTRLHLTGTGAGDVVKVLSSGVTWDGITVWKTPGVAGMRIGDAAHPGLRDISLVNATFRELATGLILDHTGTPTGSGQWNTLSGVIARDMHGNGSPGSGVGILLTGGNGKLRMFGGGGGIHDNGGAGVKIEAAPSGSSNGTFYVSGYAFWNNGTDVGGDGVSAIEAHGVSDVELEGNDFYFHNGPTSGDDGRILVFDGVTGANLNCNHFRNGDGGVYLSGGTSGVALRANDFTSLTGTALSVDATSGAGSSVNESLFHVVGTAIDRAGSGTLDASHCWFDAADGPGGAFGGTGAPVYGNVSVAGFVARAAQPLLVRKPSIGAWDFGVSSCYTHVQWAIDAAAAGSLILIGSGTYFEHPTLTKQVDIDGIASPSGCPATIIYGGQSGGSHTPTFSVTGVNGVSISHVTVSNTSDGTPCGTDTGDEIGLSLTDVTASSFTHLCLQNNGVTELRLAGNSSGNLVDDVTIDGLYRDQFGQDVCGHHSREGILVTALPACEGGSGALPANNHLSRIVADHVEQAIVVRLATTTTIDGCQLHASSAPAWVSGAGPMGVRVTASANTTITSSTIGGTGVNEAIRVEGKSASSCFTEATDATNTVIAGNTLHDALDGVRLHRASGDPGTASGTTISCNTISHDVRGILVEDGPASSLARNAIESNSTAGLDNESAVSIAATGNWWHDPSGPSGTGPGTGDAIIGPATFSGWLTSSPRADGDGDGYTACTGDCNDANAAIHPGATDVCNNIDDDCDGTIDEDFTPAPMACGVGACSRMGSSACIGGTVVPASCTPGTPSPETCNGVDDDCDGTIDNGFALGSACTSGTGACARSGVDVCSADHTGVVCNAVPGTPSPETCNGVDDDCDGTVDNNVALPSGIPELSVQRAGTVAVLAWSAVAGATGYDTVTGDTALLEAHHGDYSAANTTCLASRVAALTVSDSAPSAPGALQWYLVRAENCGGPGSYASGDPGLTGGRDASINASPGACP